MHPSGLNDPIDLELLLPAAVRSGLKCAGFAEFGAPGNRRHQAIAWLGTVQRQVRARSAAK